MSTDRQMAIRDLLEEAKKRIVFLVVCVVGLSYLMSLTSSSVLVNLPAAALLIIILRYLSLDFETRKRAAAYNNKPPAANTLYQKKPVEGVKVVDRTEWRKKVNSPVVEDAIDHFTRHLISEWVTDLWYARITPDKEGPEELILIINGVLGEMSCRMRNINLIDLLTRDFINILCTHLELFRACQAKIEKELDSLTLDQRDMELKVILAAENKLHPALFSAAAEHKVLQHLMDRLVSLTFRPEDLQCTFFRHTVRELIACAVMRPILNLVSPRFINERIESVVISKSKATKAVATALEESRSNGPSKMSSDHFSRFIDPSVTGVELVQLKNGQSVAAANKKATNNVIAKQQSKDPLLLIDTQSSRTWSSLPSGSLNSDAEGLQQRGGQWGEVLDLMSHRKTQALAPENFENMWTKGRNYKKGVNGQNEKDLHKSSRRASETVERLNSKQIDKVGVTEANLSDKRTVSSGFSTSEKHFSSLSTHQEDDELLEEADKSSSYTTEEEEPDSITGLDSPGTKVWDGKNIKNLAPSHIRHPLESSEGRKGGKANNRFQRLSRSQTGRKRSRLSGKQGPVWQEVERTSFLSGDGQDILKPNRYEKFEESSDDSEVETLGRVNSGADASSSAPSNSLLKSHILESFSVQNALLEDTFMKLRCEVLGANIVKSGSRTFAVYSISVTDANNNSWSIKRRFRHFEELHRRLKEFREYCLHLPPKHYLSAGLDLSVIRERCILLDSYLKKLLRLPSISGSIEVWDFLSVDSQTYIFSHSISIVETLSVNLSENAPDSSSVTAHFGTGTNAFSSKKEQLRAESKGGKQVQQNFVANGSKQNLDSMPRSPVKKTGKEHRKSVEDQCGDLDASGPKNLSSFKSIGKEAKEREGVGLQRKSEVRVDAVADPTLPMEWVPPNLSVPILDLVDVILQLQDGGWIRRQAFWVAKQVLQLGMGDAFDDWLMEKIQLLRKGSVVASGIKRVEQILWPDGIFLTKHPSRQKPPPLVSPSQSFNNGSQTTISSPRAEDTQNMQGKDTNLSVEDRQQEEATRRAKFVYELMIDNPPAAVIGLIGRKEYEQCAKDLYFFLQSSVCLKQLVLDILELILVSAFPELDKAIKELQEEKHKFGEFKVS